MRFVVYGAGAIGGVLGARLHDSGREVVLVARGDHLRAIREHGLRVDDPSGSRTYRMRAAGHPGELALGDGDVVLLTTKSQDSLGALDALDGADVPVVCVQNGVANERAALRRFEHVYGVCVMCPAVHLEPGVVATPAAPVTGLLDIGRYPAGADVTAEEIAAAFRSATYGSIVRTDIMRWKHAKLLLNLGNAVEALCGREARSGELAALARAEGETCLQAAGIPYASTEEDAARRRATPVSRPASGVGRVGSSTVQGLLRGSRTIETDYLNGEIVLLGRMLGIPTPANALLQRLAAGLARGEGEPGSASEAELLGLLD
jgi:2-dehydropantoate 2-reductase